MHCMAARACWRSALSPSISMVLGGRWLWLALLSLAASGAGAAGHVKELKGVTLKIVRDRSAVLLVHYYDGGAARADVKALAGVVEEVAKGIANDGHTAGGVAAVAAVDLRESPGDRPPNLPSLPALVLYEKGGEMERDVELTLCAGADACGALDAAAISGPVEEKLGVRAERLGTNTTIPSLAECEAAVAEAEALLAEEEGKKPLPPNGTRALCSDFMNCSDCRLNGCGWCRIAQVCVVDLPNNCHGQRDHIGANGFSESCDDAECNSPDCCVQIDQKCGMIERSFGVEVRSGSFACSILQLR